MQICNKATKIAFLGSVEKSDIIINTAKNLASQGKNVVLVDINTDYTLTWKSLYASNCTLNSTEKRFSTIKDALRPVFESQPRHLTPPVLTSPFVEFPGIFLLPNSRDMIDYEVSLGLAHHLAYNNFKTLHNLPGALNYVIESYQADYVLIDTPPIMTAFTRNALMISDYFITPIIYRNQDDELKTFSTIAMVKQLYKLKVWASSLSDRVKQSEAIYPFPKPKLNLLHFLIHSNTCTIDSVKNRLEISALPVLKRANMIKGAIIYILYDSELQPKNMKAINSNIVSITDNAEPSDYELSSGLIADYMG